MKDVVSLVVVLLCSAGTAGALRWLAHDHAGSAPQQVPFLGGGDAKTHAWQRYHLRCYPMLLLFIAFEMEMMFMYPWAVVFVAEGGKALMDMGMFLAILAIGIVYAWREGIFRWQ
ncbi:NADH-quinone oxidoreductase subunit A [Dyella sp. KRB-257]|uniref:NADH-quinone oxidoreductase subunit A n=1 Tax=Dyella sp. KRB-257 TaxID=3400915 RepID=UPI003C056604